MFVNFHAVEHKTFFWQIFYFLTGFGHQAVIIFFVLSGFLVGGKVIEDVRYGRFDIGSYLINRFSRLYTVFIFALIAGYLLDWFGLHYLNQLGLYDQSHQFEISSINYSVANRLGISLFLSNLAMSQTILTPPLGSNGPLWSLANEFWYYLLFPTIMLLFFGKGNSKSKGILALILLSMIVFLTWDIIIYFVLWLIGTTLVLFKRPIFNRPLVPLFLLVITLINSRINPLSSGPNTIVVVSFVSEFLIGVAFGLTIQTLMGATNRKSKGKTFHKKMTGFSYSLYVMHFPMIVFVVSLVNYLFGVEVQMQPGASQLLLFIAILTFLYVYSYGTAKVTENNTKSIRSVLKRILRVENVRSSHRHLVAEQGD